MPRANAPGKAALLGVGGAAAVASSNQGYVDDEAIKVYSSKKLGVKICLAVTKTGSTNVSSITSAT